MEIKALCSQSIFSKNRFYRVSCIFIFGHFINVQFSKQPINNDPFPRLLRLIDFPT